MFGLSPSYSFGDDTDNYITCGEDDNTNGSFTDDTNHTNSRVLNRELQTPSLYMTMKYPTNKPSIGDLGSPYGFKIANDCGVVDGVTTDPLIQALFHVDYLPFDARLTKHYSAGDSSIDFESMDELSSMSDEDDDHLLDSDDGRIYDLGTAKKSNRHKDRKRRLKGLRRRLVDPRRNGGNRQDQQSRRKDKKSLKHAKKNHIREKKNVRRKKRLNNLSFHISSELSEIEREKARLSEVKAALKCNQVESKKLMMDALKSSARVAKLASIVTELECKLDMTMRSLEYERNKTSMNVIALGNLNASQDALEEECRKLEVSLRKQLLDKTQSDAAYLKPKHTASLQHPKRVTIQERNTDDETREPPANDGDQVADDQVITAFLRIHDLNVPNEVDGEKIQFHSGKRKDLHPLHHGQRHHILNALSNYAYKIITDEGLMWTPDSATKRIISNRTMEEQKWHYLNNQEDVFIWYGNFGSNGYKGDIPVIKARGIIPTRAESLVDLIVDSSKVQLYNKMSLGREDKFFIKKGLDSHDGKINGEAKIVRSVSSIPMIRKNMEIISLMYARALSAEADGMNGYLVVSRSVWENEQHAPSESDAGHEGDSNHIRSEMLLGVNLIRPLDEETCEFTTLTHFFTPGAPTFGAKQFGMKAASNFIRDIQKHFRSNNHS